MKAYILKLVFEDVQPHVWRRIILPAGATFNRLHETIQRVTNFQSELSPYHFFAIEIEDVFITNNESIIEENKGKKYAGKTVKQPTRIKIDAYLEKHNEFIYCYDFGDDWRIRVSLEDTVEDYYFGYPTLLDGEGMAPPEDVGGPPGYEAFVRVYYDPTHPDYINTYSWAESQLYMPLDITEVNKGLKYVKYKQTEWEKIDHDNYYILSDKYRRPDYVNVDELPNKDLILQYAKACTKLYGVIEYSKFLEIYNSQNKTNLSSSELRALLTDPQYANQIATKDEFGYKEALTHEKIDYIERYTAFRQGIIGKPFYIPTKKELLRYADENYYEKTIHQQNLAKMLAKDFFGGSLLKVKDEMDELVRMLQVVHVNFQGVVQQFLRRFKMKDMKQLNEYIRAITLIANTTRIWENRGHTPEELVQMERHELKPIPSAPFHVIDGGKIGRNDPCLCGSGKKHKKCCLK